MIDSFNDPINILQRARRSCVAQNARIDRYKEEESEATWTTLSSDEDSEDEDEDDDADESSNEEDGNGNKSNEKTKGHKTNNRNTTPPKLEQSKTSLIKF